LFAGNFLAQLISFLSALIITRLYTPADFGVMTFIWSLTMTISAGVSLGYRPAIILPADDQKGFQLFFFSLLCVCFVSALAGVLCWLGVESLARWSGLLDLKKYLWAVPAGLLILGMRWNFDSLCTRFKFFKLIAVSQILVSIFTVLVKVIPGILIGSTAIWLVVGNIAGQFFPVIFLFVTLLFIMKEKQEWRVTLSSIIGAGKEYIKFPKYNLPTQILNSISQNTPVLLFAMFYSPEVIGWYGLALSMLDRPISLIVQSITVVFLQKSADIENTGESHFRSIFKTTMGLVTIGIIPLIILLIWGPKLFEILFGNNWHEAGIYARILSPWLFFNFISCPADQLLFVKQLLRFKMVLEFIYLISITVVIWGGNYFFRNDIIVTLSAFSAIGCLRGIFVLIAAFRCSTQGGGLSSSNHNICKKLN